MTLTVKRVALALGAGLIAIGVGAGAYVQAQDQNTNPPPPPFRGRGMGPGGPGRPGGPGGPMGFLPMLGPNMGLTLAQQDQIKAIGDAHAAEWKGLADRGRAAHLALDAAVTADALDDALIRQKSSEVAAVDGDIAVARAHVRAEVLQILTDDQKAALKAMRAKMKQRLSGQPDARRHPRAAGILERLGF
jgi:Spy/CpxP family protein refolding chaperone